MALSKMVLISFKEVIGPTIFNDLVPMALKRKWACGRFLDHPSSVIKLLKALQIKSGCYTQMKIPQNHTHSIARGSFGFHHLMSLALLSKTSSLHMKIILSSTLFLHLITTASLLTSAVFPRLIWTAMALKCLFLVPSGLHPYLLSRNLFQVMIIGFLPALEILMRRL